jgi:hypothetical protein
MFLIKRYYFTVICCVLTKHMHTQFDKFKFSELTKMKISPCGYEKQFTVTKFNYIVKRFME